MSERDGTETGERSWSIDSEHLGITWRREASGEVMLASLRAAGRELVAAPTPVFAATGSGPTPVAYRDVNVSVGGHVARLRGMLSPLGLTAGITWTVDAPASLAVVEIEVTNETDQPVELGSLTSLRLTLEPSPATRLAILAGGRWDEAMPPRGYQLQRFDLDELRRRHWFGAAEDGRSSGEHLPWLALVHPAGGLLASLVWSGRWGCTLERREESLTLDLGIADFAHVLAPGERLPLPGLVLAGYAGTLDDGANAWRDWLVAHWMPPMPASWPWIQYNHWYAYYGDIDARRLSEEAALAAEMGCEVFVIDDGWFRGRRPESYAAGWGDWVEDRGKFPAGLAAFGEEVHGLGMKLGLWVEPERADEHGALVREHPGWVATRRGEPIARRNETGTEGFHLCLGNPEVQQWMIAEVVRVVRDYGVDWLKWDYNIGYGLGCDATGHGHQATDGHYAHTLGLYHVLAAIRADYPELVIENCASGGHRVDLGTLRYTHTNWISDYTHRAASCRQHVQGAGLFLPLQHLNTWVLHDRDLTELRSRMGGAFGVSSWLGQWPAADRRLFRQAVAEYTRLRPLLGGRRFLLTGPLHQNWDIWQFVSRSGEESAVLAFREAGAVSEVRVIPRLVEPERSYLVQRAGTAAAVRVSGAELATAGLTIESGEAGSSELIWVTADA